MPADRELNVFRGTELVGTLYGENPLRFAYAEAWQKKPDARSIAPELPASTAEHSGDSVVAYFENLLPEAGIRNFLQIKYQTTTIFGLLAAVGGDFAGDLVILPAGKVPEAPNYQAISWLDIADQLRDPMAAASERAGAGIRLSLAGAQTKTALWVNPDGTPAIPLPGAPSSHILKPDIKGIEGIWCSAINETFIMKLGSAIGLGVAEVEYQTTTRACLIKRYDRLMQNDGKITRLHQLDLCQLDGKPSTIKYESDGGPTLARCHQILRDNGVPASDIKRLIRWVFFNLCVGNYDSHAKNLSIYYPGNNGARLTPFYDLISTAIYPGLSRNFAFKLGGENRPGSMDGRHITAMCIELNIKPRYALTLADEVCADILRHIPPAFDALMQVATPGSEQTLLERLGQYIIGNTEKIKARLAP